MSDVVALVLAIVGIIIIGSSMMISQKKTSDKIPEACEHCKREWSAIGFGFIGAMLLIVAFMVYLWHH